MSERTKRISRKVRILKHEHPEMPTKQAVAIAYNYTKKRKRDKK